MIRKKIHELSGNEVIAKPLMTMDYQIILPEGATLRSSYIEKLRDMGIMDVWVLEEDLPEKDAMESLKDSIISTVQERVKDILERHTYQNKDELAELSETVEKIINQIIEDENVAEQVFELRQRSYDLYEHSLNVCVMSILVALKLKMSQKKIQELGIGSLLHDIGHRYQIIDIYNSAYEKLSAEDISEYKKHPVYGYDALKEEDWISTTVLNIILFHHELLDGSGFPIKTSQISLECQIVTVCDTMDEMLCGIGCKRTKPYEVIEYLKNYKNIKFNNEIVDIILSYIAVYPTGIKVTTNQGEQAIVVKQNKGFQERPVLRITHDSTGEEVTGIVIKDLVKIHNIFIDKVVDEAGGEDYVRY